ncbi:MAG: OmpH family outer membrane protein [Sporomusaceae bacterium]|nr:OmpH family outer membrane protein [Sporomusaceae bacterium]
MLVIAEKPVKRMAVFIAALFMAAVFLTLAPAGTASAAPADGIGYVDMVLLMSHHPDAVKVDETLKTAAEEAEKEFAAKSAGMSDIDKQVLMNQIQMRLDVQGAEQMEALRAKVAQAVGEVAAQKGLHVVFDKGLAIYGGEDITAAVGKKLAGQ